MDAVQIERVLADLKLPAGGGITGEDLMAGFMSGDAAILDAPEKVPALWGQDDDVLWPEGEALQIVGPPGVGKTTLVGQLVRGRIGIPRDVLGFPVKPGAKRVLYLGMDRPDQIRRSLRRQFTSEHRNLLRERFVFRPGPPPADMSSDRELLLRLAQAADADTVIVDSLKDAAIGLAKDEVGAGYNLARQRALAEGVQVVELHHQRKETNGGGRPNRLSDVYGSTWLTSGAGSVMLLWGDPGDPVVEMLHLKPSVNVVGPLMLRHDHGTGETSVEQSGDLIGLARACLITGLTAKAAGEHLYGETTDKQRSRSNTEKARRALEKLTKAGHLVKREGQRGGEAGTGEARWYPNDPEQLVVDPS